jgi:hypothetical protein
MSLLGAVLLSLNIIVPLFSSQRHQQRPASIYFPFRVPRYERNRRNWFESRTRTTYRHPGDLAERIHFWIFNKVQDMINQKLKLWYNFTFTFETWSVHWLLNVPRANIRSAPTSASKGWRTPIVAFGVHRAVHFNLFKYLLLGKEKKKNFLYFINPIGCTQLNKYPW